ASGRVSPPQLSTRRPNTGRRRSRPLRGPAGFSPPSLSAPSPDFSPRSEPPGSPPPKHSGRYDTHDTTHPHRPPAGPPRGPPADHRRGVTLGSAPVGGGPPAGVGAP